MGATLQKIAFAFLVISFSLPSAFASPENDRVYQLETLSWLKSSDNVDDIFSDFLDVEFTRFFEGQSRFVVKKIFPLKDILTKSKVPYTTLIQQPEVLKKISQKYRVESLIRTRVYKEGESYRFVLEWVYAPRGDILAKHEFTFVDPKKEEGLRGSELPQHIQHALETLVSKLPFIAQITGIEGDTITVNLGRHQGIRRREILTIATLQRVKRHPKLNTIEEWSWQPTGRAMVDQVEDSLCFAKIIETEPGQSVIRYQKIREILPAPPEPLAKARAAEEIDIPRLGWIAGNVGLGSYGRDASSTTVGRGGSGFTGSLEVQGLLWLNSRWLSQLSIGAAIIKYTPTNLATAAPVGTTYDGSGSQIRVALGYSLFPAKTIFDTIGWVHFGYRSTAYTLPAAAGDLTGGSSIGSGFIGVGGEVPFKNLITIQMGIDLGLLKSATNTFPAFGEPSSSTDLMFEFGAGYKIADRLSARLLLKVNSQSMEFTAGETLSQKVLSVGPSILYYF